jgi:hypothetical protein
MLLTFLCFIPTLGFTQSCMDEAPESLDSLSDDLMSVFVKPFETDFCTGYKEGTSKVPLLWADCCKEHDLYLWAGGTRKQRRQADRRLRKCVRDKGAPIHGIIMWLGVRIGKLSPIKIKGHQWGNAWGHKVRREKLSKDEIKALQQSLTQHSDLSPEQIIDFIQELEASN